MNSHTAFETGAGKHAEIRFKYDMFLMLGPRTSAGCSLGVWSGHSDLVEMLHLDGHRPLPFAEAGKGESPRHAASASRTCS